MSVGIGMIGREITMTVGGITLLGVVDKAISRSNTALDTTDDQSSGNRELLAKAGLKETTLTVSGTFKNLELLTTYFGTSQMVEAVVTYPDGSTETFDAFMEAVDTDFPANDLSTFSTTLLSSGATVFVAGV